MKNTILIIVGIVAICGVVVWAIQSEGEKLRDEMKETTDTSIRESVGEAADKVSGDVTGDMAGEARKKSTELFGKAVDQVGVLIDGTSGKTTDAENSSQQKTDSAEKLDPVGLLGDAIKLGQETIKSADQFGQQLLGLSAKEENHFGAAIHQKVRSQLKISSRSVETRRLQRLAQPLLNKTTREGISYRFFIVEDKMINAFAHLGGYVYVTRGLLDVVGDDDHLQFVLGHEIAHVELKHVHSATYAARASEVAGQAGEIIVTLAYKAISAGYSEQAELESDSWSLRQILKSGGSREKCIELVQLIGEHTAPASEETGAKKPAQAETTADKVAGKVAEEIHNHFRTHPPTEERIENLRTLKP